jgi:hypothetical protein
MEASMATTHTGGLIADARNPVWAVLEYVRGHLSECDDPADESGNIQQDRDIT